MSTVAFSQYLFNGDAIAYVSPLSQASGTHYSFNVSLVNGEIVTFQSDSSSETDMAAFKVRYEKFCEGFSHSIRHLQD